MVFIKNSFYKKQKVVILNVAKQFDIQIIILYCRMCLVELKGLVKLVVSCTFNISEGMEIFIDSDFVLHFLVYFKVFVDKGQIGVDLTVYSTMEKTKMSNASAVLNGPLYEKFVNLKKENKLLNVKVDIIYDDFEFIDF